MNYSLQYEENVIKNDIPALSPALRERIKSMIDQKLRTRPEVFGKPLRRSLRGYRKLRVGDYRVIFRLEGNMVKIFAIRHRSNAYKRIRSVIL